MCLSVSLFVQHLLYSCVLVYAWGFVSCVCVCTLCVFRCLCMPLCVHTGFPVQVDGISVTLGVTVHMYVSVGMYVGYECVSVCVYVLVKPCGAGAGAQLHVG